MRRTVLLICCLFLTAAWAASLAQVGEAPRPATGEPAVSDVVRHRADGPGGVGSAAPLVPPPLPPILVSPAEWAMVSSATPTFTWREAAEALGYGLEVYVALSDERVIQQVVEAPLLHYTVPPEEALAWDTQYYWRMCAGNLDGVSDWSPRRFFATPPQAPPPPTLLYPKDIRVDTTAPTFQWKRDRDCNMGCEQDAEYRLLVDDSPAFESPFVFDVTQQVEAGVLDAQRVLPAGTLVVNKTYYWKVTISSPRGSGESVSSSFQTPEHEAPTITGYSARYGYRNKHEAGVFVSLPVQGEGALLDPSESCPVLNRFTAYVAEPDPSRSVGYVEFTMKGPFGNVLETKRDDAPEQTDDPPDPERPTHWKSRAEFDMSKLWPTLGHKWLYPSLEITAYDTAEEASAVYAVTILVIPPPSWLSQPWTYQPPGVQKAVFVGYKDVPYYIFRTSVPGNPPFLGFDGPGGGLGLPEIDLPIIGRLPTAFQMDLAVREEFFVSGYWTYSAEGVADATVLAWPAASGYEFLLDPDSGTSPDYFRALNEYLLSEQQLWGLSGQSPTFSYTQPLEVLGVTMTLTFTAEFGYSVDLTISGRLRENLTADPLQFTAGAGVYAEFWAIADVLYGVAKAEVGIRPSGDFTISVAYAHDHLPSPMYVTSPCMELAVDVRAKGELIGGKLGLSFDTGWFELFTYSWGDCAAALEVSRTVEPQQGETERSILAAPDLAWNRDEDVGLLLWIDDRDPAPESTDPELAYALLAPDGEVLAQGYVASNDRTESDPKVAWRSPHPVTGQPRAVAVWTQNEIPQADAGGYDNLDDVLAQQEIYGALWGEDGSPGWSAPVRLTQNEVPDGRPALAVDPDADRVLVAWVRDQDLQVSTSGSLDICLRSYEAGEWTPEIVMWAPEGADLEPAVACQGGRSALVWVSDADADLTTNPDRLLWYATQDGAAEWSAPQPIPGSDGALYPSVDLDPSGQPVIAFCQRLDFEDGPAGEGTRDFLRYAFLKDGEWVVGRPGDQETRGQWPLVQVSDGSVATIVFRSLEVDGVVRLPGEPARVEVDLEQADAPEAERSSPPTCLTDDDCLDWQIAFDLGQSDVSHIITVTDVLRDGMMPTGAAEVAPDIWFFSTAPLPGPPVITSPDERTLLTDAQQPTITIAGTAPAEATSVALYGDGEVTQVVDCVGGQWSVERQVLVPPGKTEYRAASRNAAGESAKSPAVTVIWNVFTDLPDDHWALDQIMAAYASGIVVGYEDHTYRPSVVVSRDQMAVYISRALAGGDELVPTGPAEASFSDVPTDYWAYKYVEYAVANAIVQGYEDATYRPTLQVDRGQMAVFIARTLVSPGGDAAVPVGPLEPTFLDVPSDFWAYDQIEYLAREGVTQGYGDGTYRPANVVDRAQMAVYIQRAFELPM